MSLERILETLVSLGFTNAEAQIYVLLAKKGSQRREELAKNLTLTEQQLRNSLKSLQARGTVKVTRERSAQFSAISIEKLLNFIVNAKMEQAKALQASRQELLSMWRTMIEKDSATS